jgi:hypothetical protein
MNLGGKNLHTPKGRKLWQSSRKVNYAIRGGFAGDRPIRSQRIEARCSPAMTVVTQLARILQSNLRHSRERPSSMRTFHPDNTEFVGIGVQPDVRVNETVLDIQSGRDSAVTTALATLENIRKK